MSESSSRRDFLRTGTALLASGLAVPKERVAIPDVGSGFDGQGSAVAGSLIGGRSASSAFEGPAAAQDLSRFAEDPRAEPPKWQAWWQNNFLRADFDMLMADATPEALTKIDPEDIIATNVDAGV